MAFGVSPKHLQEVPLNSLSPEQFLIIALECIKRLDWKVGYVSENGFIASTPFSLSSWSETFTVTVEEEKAILKSECTGSQVVDWGKNKRNIEHFLEAFEKEKEYRQQHPETMEERAEAWQPQMAPKSGNILTEPPATTKEKFGNFLALFIPVKGYFVTPILVNLNILIFLIMVINGVDILQPDGESLLAWGANFRPSTMDGEWWRLFTSCFLHIGILHLLFNMYALIYIGVLLEPLMGRVNFLIAYLLTGIFASTASLWWHDMTVSAGASGAIFGMYGVFLALLTTNVIEKHVRKTLLTSIGIFVGYNLLSGVQGGIDNAAHIGGLISGLFIGYTLYPLLKNPDNTTLKKVVPAVSGVIILVASFLIIRNIPGGISEYNRKIQRFVELEERALQIYSLPEDTPIPTLVSEIRDSGIYYWKESISLIEELDQLDLPEEFHQRNWKLTRYCEFRIMSYSLIARAIEENSDQYQDSIDYYNVEIENMINSLKE